MFDSESENRDRAVEAVESVLGLGLQLGLMHESDLDWSESELD